MDYLLRTNTKEEMDSILSSAGLVEAMTDTYGTSFLLPIAGVAVDHIGPIVKPPIMQEVDGALVEVSPGSTDERWHTNIRVGFELTEEQIALLPQVDPPPAIPYRIFA